MDIFLNPCRCQCEKQVTKTQLIVIMKQNSLQIRQPYKMLSSQGQRETIAMEPRHMDVRRQGIFKSKIPQQIDFNDLEYLIHDPIFQRLQNFTQQTQCKNFERTSVNQTTMMKFKSVDIILKPSSQSTSKNQKILNEKIMNGQIEEETQRKTMKKHKIPPRQIKEQAKDLLLTTKRCKKQYNPANPSPQSNKENLSLIFQEPQHKLLKNKGKQNEPRNIKANVENNRTENPCEKSIKLMIDEIGILKGQLERLEKDQKRLLREKQQKERFFEEDFGINQKKKENLKKSCQQRYTQINDLKRLLFECKSRSI